MAVTAFDSDTQTCTVTTEHTLASVDEAGVYTLHLDLDDLAAGDVLEVRVYQTILSGGTSRVAYFDAFAGVQPTLGKVVISPPISNDLAVTDALKFTITQTLGTSRDIPWKVLKHG